MMPIPPAKPCPPVCQTWVDQERQRIGRQLHDELGGDLLGVSLALARLQQKLVQETAPAWLAEELAYLASLLQHSMQTTARIGQSLAPPVLAHGIVAALTRQASEFARQSGLACSFDCTLDTLALAPDQALALYLITQEALTNVAKHAHASQVQVTLDRDATGVTLKIRDNGQGLAAPDALQSGQTPSSSAVSAVSALPSAGMGWQSMHERARGIGAQLAVSSTRLGVTWCLHLPLP